jgi:hypothetical protein
MSSVVAGEVCPQLRAGRTEAALPSLFFVIPAEAGIHKHGVWGVWDLVIREAWMLAMPPSKGAWDRAMRETRGGSVFFSPSLEGRG